MQATLREPRPVPPYGWIKPLRPMLVHVVIDVDNPFNIGSEACLTGKINGHMDSQTAFPRYGIYQATKWRGTCKGEVVTFGKMQDWN